MTGDTEITRRAEALKLLLKERLGVGGRDLAVALRRARWRLPRRLRGQADMVASAARMGANPKLARRLNGPALDAAFRDLRGYLKGIDVGEVRKDRILGWLSVIVFDLILIAGAFVLWLWWRGYV
ncbi:hypothetical protein R5H30_05125 [Sulfitobacter sp. D35]|uniref:hypothetical protein n=1 Tax=Sulfitobacter sp. D35 TaxID=3083252 RepID=UPI00296F3DF5|nr:hypothetical protein [Sulfitobacter sp. D35]MDW4497355.1 hypothetical protein [Sulfitobacter sp. D35]